MSDNDLLALWKERAELLDRNWAVHHTACLKAIREALGATDEATVPEMAEMIRQLRRRERGKK